MRKVEIDIYEILDLICSSEDYGFNNSTLLYSFKEMLDSLSNDEIENYCSYFLSEEAINQGYTNEDYEICKERLIEFKEKYFNETTNN